MTEPYRDFNPYTDRDPADFLGPAPTRLRRFQAFAVRNIPLVSLVAPSYPIVIDVNHWVTVDLALAKQQSKIAGVIVKLTEGDGKAVSFKDPSADAYIRTAVDLGLPVGAYHFFRQNWSGDDQANWFLECAEPYRSLPGIKWIYPHIDRETQDGVTNQETSNWRAYKCASTIRSNWVTPGFYTNLNNYNLLFHIGLKVVDWVNEFPWWWAQWTSALSPTWPAAIAAARRNLWQNGIAGSHTWITPIAGAKVVDHGYDLAGVTVQPDPEPPPPPPPSDDLLARVAALEAHASALQSGLDATKLITNAADARSRDNAQDITQLVKIVTAINEEIAAIKRSNGLQDGRLDDIENTLARVKAEL